MNMGCTAILKMAGALNEKPHSQYAHNNGEDNADAHMKRQIWDEVVVAITDDAST